MSRIDCHTYVQYLFYPYLLSHKNILNKHYEDVIHKILGLRTTDRIRYGVPFERKHGIVYVNQ
jgi:hypothetical protein